MTKKQKYILNTLRKAYEDSVKQINNNLFLVESDKLLLRSEIFLKYLKDQQKVFKP